jgi:hypothetical protein
MRSIESSIGLTLGIIPHIFVVTLRSHNNVPNLMKENQRA